MLGIIVELSPQPSRGGCWRLFRGLELRPYMDLTMSMVDHMLVRSITSIEPNLVHAVTT